MTPGQTVYVLRAGSVCRGVVVAASHLVTIQIAGGPEVVRAPCDVFATEGGARGSLDASRALIRQAEVARFRRAHVAE